MKTFNGKTVLIGICKRKHEQNQRNNVPFDETYRGGEDDNLLSRSKTLPRSDWSDPSRLRDPNPPKIKTQAIPPSFLLLLHSILLSSHLLLYNRNQVFIFFYQERNYLIDPSKLNSRLLAHIYPSLFHLCGCLLSYPASLVT